jgi:hypothetical protein
VFLELGEKRPEALCAEVWPACPTFPGGEVMFDQTTLRFELNHSGGYLDQGFWEHFQSENPDEYNRKAKYKTVGDPNNPDDLYFAIGRCSPF